MRQWNTFSFILFTYSLFLSATHASEQCAITNNTSIIYFVSTEGHDYGGDGSRIHPWRTIEFAISKAGEGSTILVKPGIYVGTTRVKKHFNKSLLIKSEIPYLAKLTNNKRVLVIVGNASNISIEGFEITHLDKNASPLVVHIDSYGKRGVNNIVLKNNIIHDSFNNDLLKINNGAQNITVECNMFYNQGDSDEHIDINSVSHITVKNNIFFNDFPKSDREITKQSSSYVVVKDSNGKEDQFLGANKITITGNIFFNWQGSRGQGFLLIGEDGKPYFEASNVTISNNLMIGNSPYQMRSPFGVKGAHNISFYQNTVIGDLPSNAFAMRINTEGKNPINNNIFFYQNIWSDPYGTMGQGETEKTDDFSDTFFYQLRNFSLKNNLYWNGGNKLPYSVLDKINISADPSPYTFNPLFPVNKNMVTPVWNNKKQSFNDGSFTIVEAFERIIYLYGIPKYLPTMKDNDTNHTLSLIDILGKKRKNRTVIGAVSLRNNDRKLFN